MRKQEQAELVGGLGVWLEQAKFAQRQAIGLKTFGENRHCKKWPRSDRVRIMELAARYIGDGDPPWQMTAANFAFRRH